MRRRRTVGLAALVAIVALALPPAMPGASAAVPNYVALGDSYTAGPLIPNFVKPYGCLKSDHNYPHLLAANLGIELRDVSCSGAETGDMFAEQGVSPGPNPAQLDALDADTTLVTLGIGGNDIGFSSIAKDCVAIDPTKTPCQDHYVQNGVDELARRIDETAPKIAQVLQAIHTRAPAAQVFVVGYLPILPESGLGCWPTLPISFKDVAYLRDTEKRLNAMIEQAANANDATYVDVYTPSIGHDACQPPALRWVEQVAPTQPAAPLHPNLEGEMAYKHYLVDALHAKGNILAGLVPGL